MRLSRIGLALAPAAPIFTALMFAAMPPAPEAKAAAPTASCTDMAASNLFRDAAISSAKMIPADAAHGLPAYCELKGFASPSEDSHVGFIYRLPDDWNGKFLGLGGGGWAGDLSLAEASQGLSRGYATAQTDTGHPSPDPANLNWALASPGKLDADATKDFGYRAVHAVADLGRRLMIRYYGKTATKSYFEGCSTGGRQGLMEAQRFPEDYDGIIAGAPVYDFTVQTSAVLRTQFFHDGPHSNLMPAQASLVNKAVMAACDALDGLKDGIITDPRLCKWDPVVLQCKAGETPPACLSADQVATVRKAYAGAKASDGRVAAWPLMPGGELDWVGRSIGGPGAPLGSNVTLGAKGIELLVYKDPNLDILTLTADDMLKKVDASTYHILYEAKDPRINDYTKRGGKLLLYHGLEDNGPSPLATIQYYEQAKDFGPGAVALFLVPGMGHCRGGPGPDQFDMLAALDQWSTTSKAPQTIPASNKDSGIQRPLCAYPALPAYDGSGDPKALGSFTCKAPPKP